MIANYFPPNTQQMTYPLYFSKVWMPQVSIKHRTGYWIRGRWRTYSLTSFVRNNWNIGWLWPYDIKWPQVMVGAIIDPLNAYTGLKCNLQQFVGWTQLSKKSFTEPFSSVLLRYFDSLDKIYYEIVLKSNKHKIGNNTFPSSERV